MSEVRGELAGEHQKEVLSMQGQFSFFSALLESPEEYLQEEQGLPRMQRLNHHAGTTFGKWVPSKVEAHPRVEVTLRLAREDYGQLHLPEPKEDQRVKKQAVTETGALMVVVSLEGAESMKIRRSELIPVELKISAANSSKMVLMGLH